MGPWLRGGVVSALVCTWAAACSRLPIPAPTPIPSATREPRPTAPRPLPTVTLRPRDLTCQFPLDYDGDGQLESGGLYSFLWQGAAIKLNTGAGQLTLTAPAGLPAGSRDLMLVFDGPLQTSLELPPNLPPGGSVLYDPARLSAEYRDVNGRPFLQRLVDPSSDGLFAINQDIVQVERSFGAGAVFTMTIVLRGRRGILLETQYEAWRLSQGQATYEYQIARSGQATALVGADPASLQPYDGPVTFSGSSLSYEYASGAESPFSASTYTTAVTGDRTAVFPAAELPRLFTAAEAACRP